MDQSQQPLPAALDARQIAPRAQASLYPAPFAARFGGRSKRVLGEAFGLANFGVNLTTLAPGASSSLRHAHSRQDEFVYVLEGHPTLITDAGETPLAPGMCAGFRAGRGDAHQLVNRSDAPVVYLEVGDRSVGDEVVYPDDDLAMTIGADGRRLFTRKDGSAY